MSSHQLNSEIIIESEYYNCFSCFNEFNLNLLTNCQCTAPYVLSAGMPVEWINLFDCTQCVENYNLGLKNC